MSSGIGIIHFEHAFISWACYNHVICNVYYLHEEENEIMSSYNNVQPIRTMKYLCLKH